MRSPCSSCTTACTRTPRMPTQAPTGSMLLSLEITRDLGAAARIARHGADFDDAVIDFRHFLREQAHHELRMAARQEDLRAAGFAAHVIDIGADAVAGAEDFARDHLVAAHHAFGLAQIDHDRAEFANA